MTEEVGHHVLAHNYAQTLALSLQEADAAAELDAHARFMPDLEAAAGWTARSRACPAPPPIAELRAAGRGLTRPELAVLTAYGKLELSAEIVDAAAPDDPYFEDTLDATSPSRLPTLRGRRCGATGCGATSSPPCSPTRWSTWRARPSPRA